MKLDEPVSLEIDRSQRGNDLLMGFYCGRSHCVGSLHWEPLHCETHHRIGYRVGLNLLRHRSQTFLPPIRSRRKQLFRALAEYFDNPTERRPSIISRS